MTRPIDEERFERYIIAFADPGATTPRLPNEHASEWSARVAMALADAEHEELRATVDRVRDALNRAAGAL
jgi:hypothetical protein